MEKVRGSKTLNEDLSSAATEAEGFQSSSLRSVGRIVSQDIISGSSFIGLEAALPSGSSPHALPGVVTEKTAARQISSEVKIHPEDSPEMLSRVTAHDHDKYHLRGNLEAPKSSKFSGDQMDREMLLTEDSRLDGYNAVTSSGYPENQRKGIIRIDSQRLSAEDGEMNTIEDGNSSGHLSSSSKGSPNSNLSEIEQRDCEIKRSKQAKGKICSEAEKELSSQPSAKVVNTKVTDSPPLEGLQGMRSDRKVHEPLNTFIRQTVDREPNLSLSSTSGDQPPQRLAEHLATNKYVKSLKVDFENLEENAIVNSYQVDIEIDTSGTNGGGDLPHRNLQTVKNTVPQTLAAFSAGVAKNPGKQNLGTDSPGCSLLPPSKVQLQKCEKCSREFFSPFNHRRHTRTHRRISQIEKEDLTVKRKNVAAFWDKLNQMEAYQIFASTREFVSEDLSGEAVMSNLIALKRQNNLTTLPPAYLKAGQDLLDMLNNEKSDELPLFSSQVLSALDDASEKTFLCSQRDVSKIGIEEKNLVALLGFIVEQALAWMADKDAEALRIQQELVKEEEAAQRKRERNVAKKKKKKEKSRQKGLKDRKAGAIYLALSEENESGDDENPSEIVEEINSPTASSASVNSSGLENILVESFEMEVNRQVQNVDKRDHNVGCEDANLLKENGMHFMRVICREDAPDSVDEDQMPQSECDLVSNGEEGERCSNFPTSSQVKEEGEGGVSGTSEQVRSAVASRKRSQLRPYKDPLRVGYQDSYRRGSWVCDSRFQEGAQQSSYRTSRKSLIGSPFTSNNERGSNPVLGCYRGKPASLRGIAPFPATQQWAKKAQTHPVVDHVKVANPPDQDIFASKITKELVREHTTLAREIDADTTGSSSRVENEEFRSFGTKEALSGSVPSVAEVVAGTGGQRSIPTSFSLDANSEDWPPLTDSHSAYYSKSGVMYTLASYPCELNSSSVKHSNSDRGGCYQIGFEPRAEGLIVTDTPPVRGPVNNNATESANAGLQKGIMIGSVSVPLGDYMHASWGSASSKIGTSPTHQSYTAVLAAPPVQYIRDPIAGQQMAHEGISRFEYEKSSNLQVVDPYRSSANYSALSLRSTPSMNHNIKHVRGPIYSLGDRGERGVLNKQTSWSGGPVRHLPQKVWRPIRSTIENSDRGGGSGNGSCSVSTDGKVIAEHFGAAHSAVVVIDRAEGMHDKGMNLSGDEKESASATDIEETVKEDTNVLDASQNVSNCEYVPSNNEHVQYQQKTSQNSSLIIVASENVYRPSTEQDTKCLQAKNAIALMMDDNVHVDTTLDHPTWIAEAEEFHMSRWNSSFTDPETVVHTCEDEHPELQTTTWIEFIDSLPSMATRSNPWEEDFHDPNDFSTSKELQDSCFENESPCGVDSTAVGSVLGSVNKQETAVSEVRSGSRYGSSYSDSSISSNSRREIRHPAGTGISIPEMPTEQRYMPKQGHQEEKIRC
ncbi:uncharacterized protein [Physcomitrium patens]|uniref:uncharacterized protein isoform X2 n=1 Tax=Physcomitrium patens TaxID=3218 RepID=UPI003CCD8A05